jgi:hypothetical protein
VIDPDTRLKYETIKVAARINGRDLLESLDKGALVWTPRRTKELLDRRATDIETLPIHRFLPHGVTVETATLNDLRKGIAEWLRRSA